MSEEQDDLILDDDGQPLYGLGLLPSGDTSGLVCYDDFAPTIDRSQWRDISFAESASVKIYNQGRHGSCVGHGACTAAAKVWALSYGTAHIFSPCWIYGWINGGRDAGASILAALQTLETTGVCFEDEVPEGMIYKQQFPRTAYATAARFKFKGYPVRTREALASGIQEGKMAVIGVCVGGAFQSYRGQGLVQVGAGRANHCTMADGMEMRAGKAILHGVNSWSEEWGNNGRFEIAIESIDPSEMFLLTDPIGDPNETLLPPMAE